MDFLTAIDTELLLLINGWRSAWADTFMYVFSGKVVWIPMYAAILYVLFRNLPWKVALAGVVTVALVIVFADQVTATLIRPYVERLRPANLENPISEYVQIVNGYRGGRYGFPSCHAANTFGLAFFVRYMFRVRLLTVFFLLWALVTCYSRSYLGVHYPGDLCVGAVIGFAGATLCCSLFHRLSGSYLGYQRKDELVHASAPVWVGGVTILCIAIYACMNLS